MIINLMPFVIIGVALILAVIALIVWRKIAAGQEDDTIHVLEDAAMVQTQVTVAQKLAVLDRWGKLLTIITVLYVAGVGALYFYQVWVRSGSTASM